VEPVLAIAMPFSKQYKWLGGFLFGFLSIALFDLATGKAGVWTLITSAAYGLVGLCAYWFLKSRPPTAWNFLKFGVIGTILYDALTGLTIGPIFWGQPLADAVVGQIPFTLMHLAGAVVFSLVLSPIVYRWVVMNRRFEFGGVAEAVPLGNPTKI